MQVIAGDHTAKHPPPLLAGHVHKLNKTAHPENLTQRKTGRGAWDG